MHSCKKSRSLCVVLQILLSAMFALVGCEKDSGSEETGGREIIEIPVSGISNDRHAEISGLTWYNNQLIILPQYPDHYRADGKGSIFRIPKSHILAYLAGESQTALIPQPVEFDDPDIIAGIPGFQGLEAVVFIGKRGYFAIEANVAGTMHAYLIAGNMADDLSGITLDPNSLLKLDLPVQIFNMAFEALVVVEEKILAVFEANNRLLNPDPRLLMIDPASKKITLLPFPQINFRITDATGVDSTNTFWVMNFYYPGESDLFYPQADRNHLKGSGEQNSDAARPVERIISLQFSPLKVVTTTVKPIYLKKGDTDPPNNWEGLARLDARGFIVATDKHPRTIIAFVPSD